MEANCSRCSQLLSTIHAASAPAASDVGTGTRGSSAKWLDFPRPRAVCVHAPARMVPRGPIRFHLRVIANTSTGAQWVRVFAGAAPSRESLPAAASSHPPSAVAATTAANHSDIDNETSDAMMQRQLKYVLKAIKLDWRALLHKRVASEVLTLFRAIRATR